MVGRYYKRISIWFYSLQAGLDLISQGHMLADVVAIIGKSLIRLPSGRFPLSRNFLRAYEFFYPVDSPLIHKKEQKKRP